MAVVFALALSWLRIPGQAVPWSALPGRPQRDSDRGTAGEDVLLVIVALAVLSLAAVVLIMLKVNSALDHVSHP